MATVKFYSGCVSTYYVKESKLKIFFKKIWLFFKIRKNPLKKLQVWRSKMLSEHYVQVIDYSETHVEYFFIFSGPEIRIVDPIFEFYKRFIKITFET